MYLYSPLMVHAHTRRGGRRVLKRQRKWLRWKKSILICSAVERNIRLSWEWWALRCFKRPTRYCSTFQCTLTEASGYLRCLNNSSVVDIYRAGPCMKCHHTLGGSGGHKLLVSSGSSCTQRLQRSFGLNQRHCQQWEFIRKPGKCRTGLRVRDLLHVGLLQSWTTLFFLPLLRSFTMYSSRSTDSAFWGTAGRKEDIHLVKVSVTLPRRSLISLLLLSPFLGGNLTFIILSVCSRQAGSA